MISTNEKMISELFWHTKADSLEQKMFESIIVALTIHEEKGFSPDRLILNPSYYGLLKKYVGRLRRDDASRLAISRIPAQFGFKVTRLLGMRIEENPLLYVPFRIADERGYPRQRLKFPKKGFFRESRHA